MTCICAIAEEGKTWIGADSAGANSSQIFTRKDPKLFRKGNMLIGFTSSYRMGQLLRYSLILPKHYEGVSVEEYLHTVFIDEVRETLSKGGFLRKDREEEIGGVFIVGYKGRLFTVESDFQIGETVCGYHAVGCGDSVALGSLYSTNGAGLSSEKRIKIALEAAQEFCLGVRGPFLIESLD